jgi:hypothetical protein
MEPRSRREGKVQHRVWQRSSQRLRLIVSLAVLAALLSTVGATQARSAQGTSGPENPTFTEAAAFDVSKPLRQLAQTTPPSSEATGGEVRPDSGPTVADRGPSSDAALQSEVGTLAIPAPSANFEGLSNQDNFDIFGFRVNPPDPVGDVGPNHYVEMVNLVFAVFDKAGTKLLGPVDTGTLWAGFAIEDCTDPSGDPIVVYDQTTDRWLLSQFTTRGLTNPTRPFYNCVAVSTTGDPTGSYFRYAFITQPDPVVGNFFPDYPKYGVWSNSYILTTRDFGNIAGYGISVYALEKDKMVNGDPNARAVQFFLDSEEVPINLIGDGLLPPDLDGSKQPSRNAPAPIVGTQDDGGPYGATFDALNIWDLRVTWRSTPTASLVLSAQLPVAAFDSIYPCGVEPSTTPGSMPNSRDCLPQPGVTDGSRFLDILSYRQRPTWRLAYRNFGKFESLVTNQSVEAAPEQAGVRWYEIRRTGGTYSIRQQGTFAPNDGVHRWMGSIAMDRRGNMGLGYSVVNATDVFPGIRYTGRLAGDPLGVMTLGEGTIIDGSGVQTTTNSRWGDYTSMNIDPVDDCTFWYVNEYYTAAGQASSSAGWQTRIGSFRLPGC